MLLVVPSHDSSGSLRPVVFLSVGFWGFWLASLNRSFAQLLMVTRTNYMLLCCENGGILERRSSPAHIHRNRSSELPGV